MGTDIHVYIEHKSRKNNKYVFDFEADTNRAYSLFGVLAGARGDLDPIYIPRGIPKDVSPETLKEYEDFGADAHTASWLSTEEYRKCLDFHFRILSERKELSIEHIREWVEQYEKIYDYMEYSENEGEPSRIVLWLDN
jgi:hypothetical protein